MHENIAFISVLFNLKKCQSNNVGCKSGPDAALAVVVEDSARPTAPVVGDSSCTHVELVPVLFVGIHAIGFSVTEACAWSVGGGGGWGSWALGGGLAGVRGRGRGQGWQL